jgi:hypothetical protein
MVRGPADLGVQRGFVEGLGRELRLPLFAARTTPVPRLRVDSVIVERGGVRLGIVGIPGAAVSEVASYTAAALALRAQGAELVIALVPERAERALAIARELRRVDVVVTGGSAGAPLPPRLVGAALVVDGADRGRALGLLRLHPRGGGPWTFDERGDEPMPPPVAPPGRSVTFTLEPIGPPQPCAVTPR